MIRCSIGTAKVLGLKSIKVDALPTTAYLMAGEKCRFNCAFCAQARESSARADLLSRVSWPLFSREQVAKRIEDLAGGGKEFPVGGEPAESDGTELQRICFQVVQDQEALKSVKTWVQELNQRTRLPICVSAGPQNLEEIAELLALGVDHVSIALDAATPAVFAQVKDGSWQQRYRLLMSGAARFPGHLATHLIVGLGETEEEMIRLLQELHDHGITVALFAFTPVRGTRLEQALPPPMPHYRRVQAAHFLIRNSLARVEQFSFARGKQREGHPEGKLIDFGMPREELRPLLADGEAFRTSGCSGCNRPYYNETPGEELYNYPRPLTPAESETAWQRLFE